LAWDIKKCQRKAGMKTGSNVSNVVPDRGAQKETTLFPLLVNKMIIRLIIEYKVISPGNFPP